MVIVVMGETLEEVEDMIYSAIIQWKMYIYY